jgi:flagellar assembly factor FliW
MIHEFGEKFNPKEKSIALKRPCQSFSMIHKVIVQLFQEKTPRTIGVRGVSHVILISSSSGETQADSARG